MLSVGDSVLVKSYGEVADDALVAVVLSLEGGYKLGGSLEFDQVIES